MCDQDPNHLATKLEMTNEQDREYMRKKMKRLKRNPQLSFSSSFSSLDFSHSAISLHALSQVGPKKVRFDPKTFYHPDSQEKITVRCFYRGMCSHHFSFSLFLSFSCYFPSELLIICSFYCCTDRMHLFSIHRDTSFSRLRNKIRSILTRAKFVVQQVYQPSDGLRGGSASAIHYRGNAEEQRESIFAIRNDEDLVQAIAYEPPREV
jgi:hypothetical protein